MIPIRPVGPPATLDSPIDHLNACHRRIEERLNTLERAAPHLLDKTDEALSAIRAAIRFFEASGVHHTADEEESFFPRLAAHLTPEERQFLNGLEAEHHHAEAIFAKLKAHVTSMATPPTEPDQRACMELAQALCAVYRQHIKNEDARFPAIAARALSAADILAISEEMKRRRGI